ncbi:hypothetical protein ACR4TH_000631 [Enterobacter hormaechei]|uniref:hypothetical protein n=1 Tax=Enterobacter hormaechei TaxID=158836 RepID=UPI00020CF348|nr:hypothetical protein [Enterobacter hormaechei]EGK62285.1 hypothetical protein HMPREF9086_1339 [Enterobacter hormaechei ATCC 49162]MCL8171591.1 hypothetical protein [Enterobacter hormaechei]MCM7300785.1 hypothetical protein [Enterobacter hormaechei]MCM7350566.1 hypothetical protein [Enterobacter hormaechei]UQQ44842.1 hypothetical protein MUY31_13405 [Enterobacter hormaechei]
MSNKYEDLVKNARMNADCGEHMSPAEVTTLLNVVETTFAALAAENAGLKSAISEHSDGFTVCPCCGTEHDSCHDDVCRALNETPATDAFLAEVRAQGVEMFAESQKEYVRKNRDELDSMTRAAYCGSAVDAERFAAQLRKGVQS